MSVVVAGTAGDFELGSFFHLLAFRYGILDERNQGSRIGFVFSF